MGHIKYRYEPMATSVFTPQKKQEVSDTDVPRVTFHRQHLPYLVETAEGSMINIRQVMKFTARETSIQKTYFYRSKQDFYCSKHFG